MENKNTRANGKISVIVPVYKTEPWSVQCVDSILGQTFTDFELILVDDGSPDGCPKMCDAYAEKDSQVVVIHKKNGDVSSARNAGMQAATGKYITFCDSDDYVLNDWLKDLYIGISNNDCDFCCCGISGHADVHKADYNIPAGLYKQSDFIFLLNDRLLNSVYTKIFYKNIIVKNNLIFDENTNNGEDLLFVLSYIECASKGFYFFGEKNYVYRNNESGKTHNYIENYWEETKHRYKYLKEIAAKFDNDTDEIESMYNKMILDAVYYAVKNNLINPNRSIFNKIADNYRIVRSKECSKALAAEARESKDNRFVFIICFYLKLLAYQLRLIV